MPKNRDHGMFVEERTEYGPSLRDKFAMAALTGIVSRGDLSFEAAAIAAYQQADAMLAAREDPSDGDG